jgi:hypothetical protein
MTTLNDDSQGKSPFQHPVHLYLTLLTLTSSIITFFFLGESNRMATNIGFLAPGRDEHGLGLQIGRKG